MQQSRPPSDNLGAWLMAGVLCFGVVSAYVVVSSPVPDGLAPDIVSTEQPKLAPGAYPAIAETGHTGTIAELAASEAVPAVEPTKTLEPTPPPAVAPVETLAPPPADKPKPSPAPRLEPKPKPRPKPKPEPEPKPVPVFSPNTSRSPTLQPTLGRPPLTLPVPAAIATPLVSAVAPPPAPSGARVPSESSRAMPVVAAMLVPPKPVVVLATRDKAWVRIDERRTIIVNKGDLVPGLGRLLETSATSVKFENATLAVTLE